MRGHERVAATVLVVVPVAPPAAVRRTRIRRRVGRAQTSARARGARWHVTVVRAPAVTVRDALHAAVLPMVAAMLTVPVSDGVTVTDNVVP